jgi:REP element-mobilizing transposase RayT
MGWTGDRFTNRKAVSPPPLLPINGNVLTAATKIFQKSLSSIMELDTIYFYTVAITNWIPLLKPDSYKQIVLDSLIHLVNKKKIKVYGFVIMPNHIHIIWENITMNGKEKPYASFMKFTGHQFLNELTKENSPLISKFTVTANDRVHHFWQKDARSVIMYDRKILEQKLDYIHLNPLQEHWNLVADPNDYYFSSCSYYEHADSTFSWLTHYMDVL